MATRTKTISTKEVVTLKENDDGQALSTGDNWSCPCTAGVTRAKKPPGHDNCDRHKAFVKWRDEEFKKHKMELRSLSDKLSTAESESRAKERQCREFSTDCLKWRTLFNNADSQLDNKKRLITTLEKDNLSLEREMVSFEKSTADEVKELWDIIITDIPKLYREIDTANEKCRLFESRQEARAAKRQAKRAKLDA